MTTSLPLAHACRTFTQLISGFGFVLNLKFPPPFNTIVGWLSFLSIDLDLLRCWQLFRTRWDFFQVRASLLSPSLSSSQKPRSRPPTRYHHLNRPSS